MLGHLGLRICVARDACGVVFCGGVSFGHGFGVDDGAFCGGGQVSSQLRFAQGLEDLDLEHHPSFVQQQLAFAQRQLVDHQLQQNPLKQQLELVAHSPQLKP